VEIEPPTTWGADLDVFIIVFDEELAGELPFVVFLNEQRNGDVDIFVDRSIGGYHVLHGDFLVIGLVSKEVFGVYFVHELYIGVMKEIDTRVESSFVVVDCDCHVFA
jgi:hypothetical protein